MIEYNFSNKTVLVTGAGRGMGREVAKTLVKCGAKVVALSIIEEELRTLKQEVPQIITVKCDIANNKQVKELIPPHGPYHCLANIAGIIELQPFLDVTEESFDRVVAVNTKGMVFVSQVVAKQMIEHKIEGTIVTISSQASKVGVRDHTAYCASKAAVNLITKVMAIELAPYGIRSNCVNPTVVMTELGKIGWSDPVKAKTMLDRIPLHRFAEVEDVVTTVLFLLSDNNKMINGETVMVDGGALSN
uniref:Lung carbonyl reductase n=1 Tax=Riptortus pedestris TaxID=329032 RepID=R4WR03_RIPPE|nr:lung carbonyl reductase [Riptortus pedestris]